MSSKDNGVLGQQVDYPSEYAPELLEPIARKLSRNTLGIAEPLPFRGVDYWTAYEVSWLDERGKPHVAIGEFLVPADSPNIIESKSFKLYLNSLNQARFSRLENVVAVLEKDLSAAAGASVLVHLSLLSQASQAHVGLLPGECLDHLPVSINDYEPNTELLVCSENTEVSESLYSHLLKTNCPVTGQPDWGSVVVSYLGPAIDKEGLLKYIISFRQHQDFHEQCVERMFVDIMQRCKPIKLTVYARYTRRGGLDINPLRTNVDGVLLPDVRLVRQ